MKHFVIPQEITELEILDFKKDVLSDKNIVNEVNISGASYLQIAVMCGNFDLAKFVIDNGIDVNNQDDKGSTALHYCAEYKQYEIAEYILNNSGKIDIADKYGNQPLWTATFSAKVHPERIKMVELFLAFGADKNHVNKVNKTPKSFASNFEVLKYAFE